MLGDRGALRAEPALLRRASGLERQHRLRHDAREPAEQPCVLGQTARAFSCPASDGRAAFAHRTCCAAHWG
jgi:hypothetical protein